jgi:hypothetical protein
MIPRVDMEPDPFPIQKPITPETRQIGRKPFIDSLAAEVIARRHHVLLLEERRIGKTSIIRAVLDRLRSVGGVGLDIDLSDSRFESPEDLAFEIAAMARAAAVGVRERGFLRRQGAKATKAAAGVTHVAAEIATTLGVDGAGDIKNASKIFDAVQAQIGDIDTAARPKLSSVLAALELAAQFSDVPIIVFLDECQRLLEWDPVAQQDLAFAMRRTDSNLVFVFAGSNERALTQLFAEGMPLHREGLRRPVSPILVDDWTPALIERFAGLGIRATPQTILTILEASGGHPERTMTVCAIARTWAEDTGQDDLNDDLIQRAITDAKAQNSWPS